MNTKVSNGFDPDQARHFVGLDLGSNYLQRQKMSLAGIEVEHFNDISDRMRGDNFLQSQSPTLILRVNKAL